MSTNPTDNQTPQPVDKAKITKIGIVKDGTAIGWDFDCTGFTV